MKLRVAALLAFGLQAVAAHASQDHTLYYQGVVHWTKLYGTSDAPADQKIILKKEILPTQGKFVETATMPNFRNVMCDAATTVTVRGNTVTAQTDEGDNIGTGIVQGVGPQGDFDYLNITLVRVPTGTVIKDINYITPNKLIARKEIDDSNGKPLLLWESDLSLMTQVEYEVLYRQMGSVGACSKD
jgi:hypothetical protein